LHTKNAGKDKIKKRRNHRIWKSFFSKNQKRLEMKGIQGFKDSKIQKFKDSKIRFTRIEADSKIQRFKDSGRSLQGSCYRMANLASVR
jgi:hypothetical protein